MQTAIHKKSKSGLGIALGLPFGALLGMLFLDGNVGLGVGIGLLFGVIFESRTQGQVFSVLWAGGGAVVGALVGVLLGLLHGQHIVAIGRTPSITLFGLPYLPDYLIVCALVAAAAGIAVGMILEKVDPKRDR